MKVSELELGSLLTINKKYSEIIPYTRMLKTYALSGNRRNGRDVPSICFASKWIAEKQFKNDLIRSPMLYCGVTKENFTIQGTRKQHLLIAGGKMLYLSGYDVKYLEKME
jgi:hypothetical protein